VRGQQTDSALLYNDPYIAELDSLLNESGSSDFLRLMDSLINLPAPTIKSQMIVRLGYNSNVVSASRTLGLNQVCMPMQQGIGVKNTNPTITLPWVQWDTSIVLQSGGHS
jgi:hypothetical protein